MTVFEQMKRTQLPNGGSSPYDFLAAARRSMIEQYNERQSTTEQEEPMTVNLKSEVKCK